MHNGIDMQVNTLAPFLLTRLLLPDICRSSHGRIINVASVMHRFASLPSPPDAFFEDWWEGGSYRNCKLAAVAMMTTLLQASDVTGQSPTQDFLASSSTDCLFVIQLHSLRVIRYCTSSFSATYPAVDQGQMRNLHCTDSAL